MKKDKNKQLL